jgi:hypothetical protein
MAGNIPMVGFHDFLTVLIAGDYLKAKLSSDDPKLIPAIAGLLGQIQPEFAERIDFVENQLSGFDAIIATGSNNTARYFDYYFGKYPNIIRKNRNGVAVLTGEESDEDLSALADDIFLYYGLGCRNVSKLFAPENYDFKELLHTLEKRTDITEHHKYFNNYEYNKSIFLLNNTSHLDSGNVLLVEKDAFASPVSVLNFSTYNSFDALNKFLFESKNEVQCIVSVSDKVAGSIPPGTSQSPELWDYADGIDTVRFLLEIE